MEIVILPTWLETVIKQFNGDLSVLKDVKKLSDIISNEDVAFYLHAQYRYAEFLPNELANSCMPLFPVLDGALQEAYDNLRFQLPETLEPKHKHDMLFGPGMLNVNPHTTNILWSFTHDRNSHGNNVSLIARPKLLDRGLNVTVSLANQYEEFLKVVAMAKPFDEVAKLPAFKRWVELMGIQNGQNRFDFKNAYVEKLAV